MFQVSFCALKSLFICSLLFVPSIAQELLASCSLHDYDTTWHGAKEDCEGEQKKLMCYSSKDEIQKTVDKFDMTLRQPYGRPVVLWLSKRESCDPKEPDTECLYLRIVNFQSRPWHFLKTDCRERMRFICCRTESATTDTTPTTTTTKRTSTTKRSTPRTTPSTSIPKTTPSTPIPKTTSSSSNTSFHSTTHSTTFSPTAMVTANETCGSCCKPIRKRGLYWPETPFGKTVFLQCPGPDHITGDAIWSCMGKEFNPIWTPEVPDLSRCHSSILEYIKEDFEKVSVIDTVYKLSDLTEDDDKSDWMQEGDLSVYLDVVSGIPDRLSLYFRQLELPDTEKWKLAKRIVENCTTLLDNVLNGDSWDYAVEENRLRLGSGVLKSVEKFGNLLVGLMTNNMGEDNITILRKNLILQALKELPYKTLSLPSYDDKCQMSECKGLVSLQDVSLKTHFPIGVVYSYYENVSRIFYGSNGELSSPITSVSLTQNGAELHSVSAKVEITLTKFHQSSSNDSHIGTCVFWNFEEKLWDDAGCDTESSNATHTICICDHLTNFAQVVNFRGINVDSTVLFYITVIGCSLSVVSLVLCIAAFTYYRGRKTANDIRYSVHRNLCISLLLADFTLLTGLNKTANKITCALIAGFLHYFFLSAFSWMLIESVRIYMLLIIVFPSKRTHIGKYYTFGYGFPLLVVAITASVRPESYGTPNVCWLSNDEGAMWSFLGPVLVILIVNLAALILTQWKASKIVKKDNTNFALIKTCLRVAFTLSPILGVTWFMGFFVKSHFGAYAFAVPNSLQGFFIFICHCILDKSTRSLVVDSIRKKSASLHTDSSRSNKKPNAIFYHNEKPSSSNNYEESCENNHARPSRWSRVWKKPWSFFYDWYLHDDPKIIDDVRLESTPTSNHESDRNKAKIIQWKKFDDNNSFEET